MALRRSPWTGVRSPPTAPCARADPFWHARTHARSHAPAHRLCAGESGDEELASELPVVKPPPLRPTEDDMDCMGGGALTAPPAPDPLCTC